MSEPASPAEITQYPLLPLRDVVVFPHMVIPLFVGRPKSIKAMETAMEAGKSILLVAQKSAAKDEPGPQDMYSIGCVSNILQMLKLPDGTVKVLVEGGTRAHIRDIVDVRTHWIAEASAVPADGAPAPEVEALRRALLSAFDQYVKLNKKIPPEILTSLSGIDEAGRLADTVAAQLHRDAGQPAVEEEVEDLQGHQAGAGDPRQGPLWPGEGEGAHRRVPGSADARRQDEGADPVPGRRARRRQDLARPVDRQGHQPQVRAHVARRRAR